MTYPPVHPAPGPESTTGEVEATGLRKDRALPGDDPVGRHRLPARTVLYWRIHALITGIVVVGVTTMGAVTLDWYTPTLRWSIVSVAAAYFFLGQVLIVPPIRWRVFWYAVSQDEIDLQHGIVIRTRTVVPMNRVQHLKMEHGPLAARLRLASLHIHTAAGAIPIRGLDADQAEALRVRVGRLAGLADDV